MEPKAKRLTLRLTQDQYQRLTENQPADLTLNDYILNLIDQRHAAATTGTGIRIELPPDIQAIIQPHVTPNIPLTAWLEILIRRGMAPTQDVLPTLPTVTPNQSKPESTKRSLIGRLFSRRQP